MNRSARRHRSTKVPNVKLRPVHTAGASSTKAKDRRQQELEAEKEDLAHYRRIREAHQTGKARADDDEQDEESSQEDDQDVAPLLGCIICMTGTIDEKSKLSGYATTMGAKVQNALTEDATHLIAVETGSDKYNCAVRLGLPILKPDWLKELRARWTGAIDYDFDGLMEEYRLDTFERLVVALAGITEPAERTEIRKKLKSGSASTPTTFQLNGTFTHLVCGDIKDSKTMEAVSRYRRKAHRYTRRDVEIPVEGEPYVMEMKAAQEIRTVWKEWVDDSMEVQGCIDTSLYSVDCPRMPTAQRRELIDHILHEQEARNRTTRERMEAAQKLHRNRGNPGPATIITYDQTDSSTNQDIQRVTKKPKRDIDQFFEHISSDATEPQVLVKATDESIADRSIDKMSRVRSFVENAQPPSDIGEDIESMSVPIEKNTDDVNKTQEEEEEGEMHLEEDPAAGLYSDIREKSLSSLSFRLDLRDDERNKAAHNALVEHGVIKIRFPADPDMAHFHILPLGKVDLPAEIDQPLGVPVTHLFIERCLYASRVVSLGESFALQPAIVPFPLEGANKVIVGMTGFSAEEDMDRKQAEVSLQAAGVEVNSTLKKGHHTHLLIGSEAERSKSSQNKIERAKEWGIHVVGIDFIKQIYSSGKIEPAPRPVSKAQRLLGRESFRSGSAGPTLEETQFTNSTSRVTSILGEIRPLAVNKQISNTSAKASRPWQRSTSGSQALLDGELTRGIRQNSSLLGYNSVESLEAGSLIIKESAKEVMALLDTRKSNNGIPLERGESANSTSGARRRGRPPPSRLREKRAESEVTSNIILPVEELLAIRKQEEELMGGIGQTQSGFPSTQQVDQSMRITYDDPVSRRERRKLSELIATSVKDSNAQRENDQEHGEDRIGSTRSSSTEAEDKATVSAKRSASSSVSPVKASSNFQPSIQARRQPGTCTRI